VTGAFFYQKTKNLTKTVNVNRISAENDYVAHPMFDPITGAPFTYYFETEDFDERDTRNIAYVEDNEDFRKLSFTTYQMEVRWRPTAGGQVFGGLSWERSLDRDCGTSLVKPDDVEFGVPGSPAVVSPNEARFCDEYALDIPYALDFRAGLSYPLPWGLTFGASFIWNDEGDVSPTYLFAGSTRYPTGAAEGSQARFVNAVLEDGGLRTSGRQPAPACPGDCPAGGLVAGSAYNGAATGTSVDLSHDGLYDAERLKQIDLKLSKTFRYRSLTISPTVEVFNLLNQDLVITYTSQSYASTQGTFMQPNSLLQGRLFGWGARVAW
jgi:hypothetical protein